MDFAERVVALENAVDGLKASQNLGGDNYVVTEGVVRVTVEPSDFVDFYDGGYTGATVFPETFDTTPNGILQVIDIRVVRNGNTELSGWARPSVLQGRLWQFCSDGEGLGFYTLTNRPNIWFVLLYTTRRSASYNLEIQYKTNLPGAILYEKW